MFYNFNNNTKALRKLSSVTSLEMSNNDVGEKVKLTLSILTVSFYFVVFLVILLFILYVTPVLKTYCK